MTLKPLLLILSLILSLLLSHGKNLSTMPIAPSPADSTSIELITNYGTITLRLYDQTPFHRDNFIKLVESKTYDSLLFHRVIKGFMIQAGDIKSKTADSLARLGSADLPYQIPAEIVPELFHKKGALAAARNNNPQRASSSTQFNIVQGVIQNDSLLAHNQNRINHSLGRYYARLDSANKPLFDSLEAAQTRKDSVEIQRLNALAEIVLSTYTNFTRYAIPEQHQKIYQEIGGSPHLDQSYTVFGEVISGLEVVDAIAGVSTNPQNRPQNEVRILSARIISEK